MSGVLTLIDDILKAEEWRKIFYARHYPDYANEIRDAIDNRTSGLRLCKKQIELFRSAVSEAGSDAQESLAMDMILMGATIIKSMYLWMANEAEKALSTPVGSLGNSSGKKDWSTRQAMADEIDQAIAADPAFADKDQTAKDKAAYKMLGISVSGLKNWRKGDRR